MISVIIPSYNREKTILSAAYSVLNQTFSDIELIIIDDGSTDGTKEVLKEIKDKRFKYVYQKNMGACTARNLGIDLAEGEYIAFHDSDDIWHLDKLQKQIDKLKENNADVVFCKLLEYKGNSLIAANPVNMKSGFLEKGDSLFGIGTQTLLGKKEVFQNIRFDPEMPRFQECELLIRIMKKYSIYCIDEGLVDYYIGIDSISSNTNKLYDACQMIMKKHPNLRDEYPYMVKNISEILICEANTMCLLYDKRYFKFLKAGYEYNKSIKNLIRIFLSKIGLYNLMLKKYRVKNEDS